VVAGFFNRRAGRYDAAYEAPGPGRHVLGTRMTTALELIGDEPGDVLDAGMGPGRLCEQLAARGWTVAGVDVSPAMVNRARARLPEAAERLRVGAVESLPFDDEAFDIVCATGVIEYVQDLPVALRELTRVLRTDGRAVLSIPNCNAPYRISRLLWDPPARRVRRMFDRTVYERPDGIGGQTAHHFARALADAGFQIQTTQRLGALVVPAPLDSLMPVFAERLSRAAERGGWSRRAFASQFVFAATKLRATGPPL